MRALLTTLLLLLLPTLAVAMGDTEATVYTRNGEVPLSLELATTPKERAQGLMKREELAPHDGMLFVFPTEGQHGFWMKNTPLALDMVFVDARQTIVTIVHDTTPYSTSLIRPRKPVVAVIELDAGRAAREGIAIGDKVRYALPATVDVH